MSLQICPITFGEASAFVSAHHRHHPAPTGHKFSIAVADQDGAVVGVAMVGRPVARHLDDGWTLEVNRTCTTGVKNANSMLYGAAWRAAKALGYRRLITYTLASESGGSLRASGWRVVAERSSRKGWDCPSRPRVDTTDYGVQRTLWEAS
ncbi:XF1762 family protein [Mycolicibacterium austroafricanum]|uniref:XF1762 family protein n=1 Tax=Mycolicibacterium austroafricanum TaxID=39687 RepID=UPI001CA34953|nr:XF1762 family protein [Mycolicibacterium austroafricanum]QZT61276.1 hypothetical protein JN085_20120 [Mycolicibacterium austroafricanum]